MTPTNVTAPMQGTVVLVDVVPGDVVRAGQQLLLVESMKMHHAIESPASGVVEAVGVAIGNTVAIGDVVVTIAASVVAPAGIAPDAAIDLDVIRPDLDEVRIRHDVGLDAARPDAVARRRSVGRRTARENVSDLVDAGTFVEYGPG
ncbi:MAG: biotin/lipoyl-containing protein, partial [Ilumatobacteraceae bacterium]